VTPDIVHQLRERAGKQPRRIVYPEANDPRVLRAAARLVEMRMARPILVGSPAAAEKRAQELGIKLSHIEIVNPELRKQKLQLLYRQGYYAKK